MDYKERYEKALEKARKYMSKGYDVLMPEIFPELAESDDERIRKKLIEIIGYFRSRGIDQQLCEEFLAYLEKQKESTWTEEDEKIRKEIIELLKEVGRDDTGISENAKCMIAWLEKQKENPKSADSIPSDCVSDAKYEDRSPKHSDSDGTDIRDTPAYWKGWDDAMKQKEQNHPNGCFTCDEYKKGYEAGRLNGFTAGYNKAMKEVDQKEQKPEDRFEEAREKYQVEWSEEDEHRRKDAIYFLESAKKHYADTSEIEKTIAWLKSLPMKCPKSSDIWKPREEQMVALRNSLDYLSEDDYDDMLELYEQLKKLM